MNKILIGAVVAVVAVAGIGAYMYRDSFMGGQPAQAQAVMNMADIAVTKASEAGLTSPENDGGLGTGIYPWDVIQGDVNAPVTITEYASMTCAHCQSFHETEFKPILKELVATGKVRFIYRDYPLDRVALQLAEISRCLPAKVYPQFIEKIYATQKIWTKDLEKNYTKLPRQYAAELGVTAEELDACLADTELRAGISRMQTEARAIGVNSTPTIFVNNTKLTGSRSVSAIEKLIRSF